MCRCIFLPYTVQAVYAVCVCLRWTLVANLHILWSLVESCLKGIHITYYNVHIYKLSIIVQKVEESITVTWTLHSNSFLSVFSINLQDLNYCRLYLPYFAGFCEKILILRCHLLPCIWCSWDFYRCFCLPNESFVN